MGSFWDAFAVYDKNKHADPSVYGGNHNNTGDSRTQVVFSKEYRQPKIQQENLQDMRRSSTSSQDSSDVEDIKQGILPAEVEIPKNVDISNMSQTEFLRLYQSLRKGEPDNKVNR
ncbi:spg4p [Saccharomyces arboricola H-6]|uniref:Stationary phase protein 4 n=1 Tax=Saccharomyces arboricola (strain H-6 / AS 2.3317 / CBS 10644) TaxID=1160507 RepID=J8LQ49_SACAR|nr:spg4p [Saccharomyces arboricola H-6]